MSILGAMAIKATFLSACILSKVQAHMIMANPVPYSHASIDNSPLSSSNYPCKVTGDAATFYATDGIDNTYAAGSTQTLSFKGSATHGGGSCQLALSSDMQPSASTDWRVILSIEGGCPTTDLTGSSGASTYNWTVPESLTPGSYSFAWTWISKEAGQAEYYMNCAPITVTAAASKKREPAGVRRLRRDDVSYPELFVANLADINDCLTVEGSDYVYPFGGAIENPGTPADSLKYTTITSSSCVPKGQSQGGNYLPTAGATGGGSGSAASATNVAAAPTATMASGSGAASIATAASAAASSSDESATTLITSAAATETIASETVYVSPVVPKTSSTKSTGQASPSATAGGSPSGGGVTSEVSSSTQPTASSSTLSSSSTTSSDSTTSSSAAVSSTSTLPSSSTTAPSSTEATSSATSTSQTSSAKPTATATGSGGSGSSGSSGTMTGTCTDEGEFNCVGSQYQQCASGGWTAMQALPAGTSCTQGLSKGLWARRGLGPDGFVKIRRAPRGGFAS